MKNIISKDELRHEFSKAMSSMYQLEVPLYGTLIELVSKANKDMLEENPLLKSELTHTQNLSRIAQERHGAIRLGKASELFNMRRLFALMGMKPVAYYDLSVAGIPVHSTAFRPIEKKSLSVNPFRVFTSLLRTELITDQSLFDRANSLLLNREIFSNELLDLIKRSEIENGLTLKDSEELINRAVDVFRWHDDALVDIDLYDELKSEHPLIADIVSFKGPHINHLTPATLNIDQVQSAMIEQNIDAKAIVEGPPHRSCPILLRQTSFKALQEAVKFVDEEGNHTAGSHTARFGEVEQRGVALTEAGRALYDKLLSQTRSKITPSGDGSNAKEYVDALAKEFEAFPDTHRELRDAKLSYYLYSVADMNCDKDAINGQGLEELIDLGYVRYDPIIYEDFLPVSGAGMFH
jgi:uncharacterized glyoxalase superfamily metalloenzyme YdcJ